MLLDELIETEADIISLIKHDVADGVGLKISKQGGLTPSRKQRDIALAAGLVIVQEIGSEIAFAALLHMAAATPRHSLRCTRYACYGIKICGGAGCPNHSRWRYRLIYQALA